MPIELGAEMTILGANLTRRRSDLNSLPSLDYGVKSLANGNMGRSPFNVNKMFSQCSNWHDFPKYHIYLYVFTLILCTTSE